MNLKESSPGHPEPPPLVDYHPPEFSSHELPKKGVLWGRSYFQIAQATAAAGVFLSLMGALAINPIRENQKYRSLIELAGGISIGWFFPSILPEKWGDSSKSFISDYATPIFLILSQVFLNLPQHVKATSQPYFFGSFNFYGGMVLAAYVHSVVSWQLGKGVDHPLDDTRESSIMTMASIAESSSEENSDDFGDIYASAGTYSVVSPRLKMAVDTTAKRMGMAALITSVGVAAIISGVLVEKAKLFRDFGVILTGSGGARILSELWWLYANRKFTRERSFLQLDKPRYSWAIKSYSMINRIMLIAFHALPGALIVGAEVAAERNLLPLSIPIFALVGITMGWNEHLRQTRFSEVAIENLHDVRVSNQRIFPIKSPFGVVKWFVGFPCIMTFIGLTLAGYNPDQNVFQKVSPYVISSMTTFAVALYSSYFFAEGTRLAFSKKPEKKLINTAYYSTHYSLGIPLLFLYVTEKLLINDEALNLDGAYAGVWTTLAWGSFGWALGKEASSRFDFPSPRVVSSLYMALFGKYYANLLSGKA